MSARLDELLDRVRTWPPERQAQAEEALETIERLDDLPELTKAQERDLDQRLARAYDEGIASGPGRIVDIDALLESFRERAGRVG